MEKKKKLLVGIYEEEWSQEQIDAVEELGYEISFFNPGDDNPEYDPSEVEVLNCGRLFVLKGIEQFPKLKFIQLSSVGFDKIPYDQLRAKDVMIANARGLSNVPISEWICGKVLEGCKNTRAFYNQQKRHEWKLNTDVIQLAGKTITIIGLGNIGGNAAKRLKAFDTKIIAVDLIKCESEYVDESYLIDDLEEALGKSDVVIVTVPSTPETYHLINKERIAAMKDNCIFINVARGALVDENALIEACKEGKFRFVALDVLEEEPASSENELWDIPCVAVTPHNSYVTDRDLDHLYPIVYKNLVHYARGEAIENQIKY